MKTSKIIAAVALALLAATGALAETYDGVHAPVSANSRMDVRAQAVIAARSENPYAEAVSSRVAPLMSASTARGIVRSEAVAAAHGPDPYAEGYGHGVAPSMSGAVDRSAVRAQARAAARGQQMPL